MARDAVGGGTCAVCGSVANLYRCTGCGVRTCGELSKIGCSWPVFEDCPRCGLGYGIRNDEEPADSGPDLADIFGEPISDVGRVAARETANVVRVTAGVGAAAARGVANNLAAPTANVAANIGMAFQAGVGVGFAALLGAILGFFGGSALIAWICPSIFWTLFVHICGGVLLGPIVGTAACLPAAFAKRRGVPTLLVNVPLAVAIYFSAAGWWNAIAPWWSRTTFW